MISPECIVRFMRGSKAHKRFALQRFSFCRGSRPALLCGGLLLLTRPLCFQGPVRQDDILVLMESEREARRLR